MELTEAWFQRIIDEEVDGVELVLLEESGSRRRRIVRLYIDHPAGVTHELCARISGAVGRALDEADAFDGAYSLEVSSPGIERPLRKRAHFEAHTGKKVYVKTTVPVDGSKVWEGMLLEVGKDEIVLRGAGGDVRISLGEIGSARLIYDFK